MFPFTYGLTRDPFTGREDGILARAEANGTCLKLMHTQTSSEYWHRAGSLVHTDPKGKLDAELPESDRVDAIGGAQHGAGSGLVQQGGDGQLPRNPTVVHAPELVNRGPDFLTHRRTSIEPPLQIGRDGVRVPAYATTTTNAAACCCRPSPSPRPLSLVGICARVRSARKANC